MVVRVEFNLCTNPYSTVGTKGDFGLQSHLSRSECKCILIMGSHKPLVVGSSFCYEYPKKQSWGTKCDHMSRSKCK